jgi:hypothetical protein
LAEHEIPENTAGNDEEEIDNSDVFLVPRWKISEVILILSFCFKVAIFNDFIGIKERKFNK